jgi:hypothetical protein
VNLIPYENLKSSYGTSLATCYLFRVI